MMNSLKVKVGNKRAGDTGEYIGRPSPLGNPFEIGRHGSRDEVVRRYAAWLDSKKLSDNAVKTELDRLTAKLIKEKELTLVCWCSPLPCHGDILAQELLVRAETAGDLDQTRQITKKLEELIARHSLDVPASRKAGIRWLLRNLAVRNAGKPGIDECMEKIRELIKEAGRQSAS